MKKLSTRIIVVTDKDRQTQRQTGRTAAPYAVLLCNALHSKYTALLMLMLIRALSATHLTKTKLGCAT